ncbi:MAG: acylphosphatase [Chloroflexota bacterium]
MTADPARLDATIRGRVQAVGFRVFAAQAATALGLTGWVANLPDGAVRCVVEGPRPMLDRFLVDLRAGPGAARVDVIDEVWSVAVGDTDGFRIRSYAHGGD